MILPLKEEYYSLLRRRLSSTYYLPRDISDSTLYLLKRLINTILEGEKVVDSARKELNSKQYFSSHDCFELIKNRSTNYATKDDVSKLI